MHHYAHHHRIRLPLEDEADETVPASAVAALVCAALMHDEQLVALLFWETALVRAGAAAGTVPPPQRRPRCRRTRTCRSPAATRTADAAAAAVDGEAAVYPCQAAR